MSLKQLLGRQVPDCAIIGGGPVGLIFAILGSTSIGKVQIFESKKPLFLLKTVQDLRILIESSLGALGIQTQSQRPVRKDLAHINYFVQPSEIYLISLFCQLLINQLSLL